MTWVTIAISIVNRNQRDAERLRLAVEGTRATMDPGDRETKQQRQHQAYEHQYQLFLHRSAINLPQKLLNADC